MGSLLPGVAFRVYDRRAVRLLCLVTIASFGCGGVQSGSSTMTRTELRTELAQLRAKARSQRNQIRDLENQVFLLKDRAETAEVELSRADGVIPRLPVQVIEPEPGARVERERIEIAGTAPDGTEIVYVDEAANKESIRPKLAARGHDILRLPATRRKSEAKRSPRPRPRANSSAERIATTAAVPRIPKRAASVRKSDPRAQYQRHYAALRAGNHTAAIRGFRDFIRKHAAHSYSDNAQYWLGEAFYDRREYHQALAEFRRVVSEHPGGNKVPDALLKVGFCHIALGDNNKARHALQQVIAAYPNTRYATLAQQRAARLSER